MILGTAGHIDHGKTALVKALTGVDTDRLPEEKRRGITIDLGFAPLVDRRQWAQSGSWMSPVTKLVRTMLAGASGIDIALLVVAADEGVMPQTSEHLQILSLLAIPTLVVALTKSDLVNAEWLSLRKKTCLILLLVDPIFDASEVVAIPAITGDGVSELRQGISPRGRVERAGGAPAGMNNRRATNDLFRMPVDRAFTIKGTGTVVTGTVWSGTIGRDSSVTVFPPGKRSRVRGVRTMAKR